MLPSASSNDVTLPLLQPLHPLYSSFKSISCQLTMSVKIKILKNQFVISPNLLDKWPLTT